MKAVVHDRYGPPDVQHLEEVNRPIPNEDEVLVRIHATTVNRSDCHHREANWRSGLIRLLLSRSLSSYRQPRQRILGNEMAGVVEAVGAAVTEFNVGDEVFGETGWRFGTHAEYVCMRESGRIAHKPHNLSFVEAAAVCNGAINALWCLSQRDLHPGQTLLVYGASGSIGTAGVQLARYFGPHITAVCNTKNVELVRSLGADAVIDYQMEDFTENGKTYDIIFDAVGKLSFMRSRRSLKPGGAYLPTDSLRNVLWARWTARFGDKRVLFPMPDYSKKELLFIKGLIEAGHYRPVIDRCYPLEKVVDATRYVETQQKTGNVVLTVTPIAETEASRLTTQTSAPTGARA